MRKLFVALPLSPAAVEHIVRVQRDMEREKLFDGRFIPIHQLHLTLAFIGKVSSEVVTEVDAALRGVRCERIPVSLGAYGLFAKRDGAIVWVALEGDGLGVLVNDIRRVCAPWMNDDRPFVSHVTIARARQIYNEKNLVNYLVQILQVDLSWTVTSFELKESVQTAQGVDYQTVATYVCAEPHSE